MKQAERDLSCSSGRAFAVHKDFTGSHPSPISLGSLKEKAFSKGVVFEKESNHLSLCIIACSAASLRWAPSAPSVQIPDSARGGGCWGCSLQGASFQELTGCRHRRLLSRTVTFWRSSHLPLSYRRPPACPLPG